MLLWIAVGTVVIVLLAPFRLKAHVSGLNLSELAGTDWSDLVWHVDCDWLFGAVQVQAMAKRTDRPRMILRVLGFTLQQRDPSKPAKRSKKGQSKEGAKPPPNEARSRERETAGSRPSFQWQQVRRLIPEIQRVFSKLWRALHPKARGHLVYGFPDPALTGMCHGIIAARITSDRLKLQPDYMEGRLSGWAEVRMFLVPLQLIIIVVGTLLRPALRALWWPRVKAAIGLSRARSTTNASM